MKFTFRTAFIAFISVFGLVSSFAGFLMPATAFSDKNLSVSALSNFRAFAAAEMVMAIYGLYSLSKKHLQDTFLTFLLISFIGWTIGQGYSLVADGTPTALTVIAVLIQAALVPVAWAALKKK
jgi:hypothetical protein